MTREIKNLMKKWYLKSKLFNFKIRTNKCSQFEHYQLLLNENDFDWVIFSDDDDLWQSTRVEEYLNIIKHRSIGTFCLSNTVTSDNIYASSIKDLGHVSKLNSCEYINYCVKSDKIQEVIKQCCDHISSNLKSSYPIKDPFFDLYFISFLNKNNDVLKIEPKEFLYYQRSYFNMDNSKWCNEVFNK